ncbi:ion transporter [Portibacter marinus]|uniref:ion transporter n=1 Tax=Portibacter marinus TaxID=2898660 RepID=UPI001F341F85|nr:ion transporter [Portibacter marinus]
MRLRRQVYRLIDDDNSANLKINDRIGTFIMILIVLSIIAVVVESEESVRINYEGVFLWFEVIAVVIFTIEYLARVYTARLAYPELSPGRAVLKYIFSPMAIVDLLAILPFYIELAAASMGLLEIMDLRFIRVLRLMRLLRIFKLNRYNSSMKLIGDVMREEKEKLFITIFMTAILLVLASALVFTVEHEGQPEAFPNIYSSMWWAIATLTTVGYGDVYPTTAMGKILAGIIALLGIGLVALPTGILSGSFVQAINEEKERKLEEKAAEIAADVAEEVVAEHESEIEHFAICPHCGKSLDEH